MTINADCSDLQLARFLAQGAGGILLDIAANSGLSGKILGKAGDKQANDWILSILHQHRPQDAILSEESSDDKSRLGHSRCWIIDPLDGTREYSEGRDDWAVHIALSIDNQPNIGAVSLPARDQLFDSQINPYRGQVATDAKTVKLAVSRTRNVPCADKLQTALNAEMLPMGSAGVKAMAVVQGMADCYVHEGGQYEWDNCAPIAIAAAAGLHCSRIDGSALIYNQDNVFIPDLLICRPELSVEILLILNDK
ncbi:3'(2'),5'-bisphosphate nucleotidase CysQ [Sphingorhabdus lutea]|uniref:3'(2'),5-bisphosphonucleoside 3'(2')-phosphohydrolase n=2 Tax=Sphingorhabdus lutea TaxID=1913578 RepID=A0A1L3JF33_9SPHN|nr:3'(2'),5'-bisphosphate nucleotidase CysQ [Sphingorhabdus lutea]APG63748.1 3'(2'),5'-bisphosphate nucleotidase CysQ [Sphingorhabdus lutea]